MFRFYVAGIVVSVTSLSTHSSLIDNKLRTFHGRQFRKALEAVAIKLAKRQKGLFKFFEMPWKRGN